MDLKKTLTAIDAQLATLTSGNVMHRSRQIRSQISLMNTILNESNVIVVPKNALELNTSHIEGILLAVCAYYKMPFKSVISTCRAAPLPTARILAARIFYDKYGEAGVHLFTQYVGRTKQQAQYYIDNLSKVDDVIESFKKSNFLR